jgi:hypothetical protein
MSSSKDKLHSPDLMQPAQTGLKAASPDLSMRMTPASRSVLLFTVTCDGKTIRKITPGRDEALSAQK